jgi:hypothetical protein
MRHAVRRAAEVVTTLSLLVTLVRGLTSLDGDAQISIIEHVADIADPVAPFTFGARTE